MIIATAIAAFVVMLWGLWLQFHKQKYGRWFSYVGAGGLIALQIILLAEGCRTNPLLYKPVCDPAKDERPWKALEPSSEL